MVVDVGAAFGMRAPAPALKLLLWCKLWTQMINEATDTIPCWDEYVKSRVVTTGCIPSSSGESLQSANQA